MFYFFQNPRSKIIQGVSKWTQNSYPTRVIPVSKKSYPLLIYPKDHSMAIMATSMIGKGRVVLSGHADHLALLKEQTTTFMKNLAKWLTGGSTPHFHDVKELMKEKEKMNEPGGIILWNLNYNASKEIADLTNSLVSSGNASLILAGKKWTLHGDGSSYTWYSLYQETGVYQSSTIVSRSKEIWGMDNVALITSLPVERKLDLLIASTKAFYDFGPNILSYLNEFSPKLLEAIGAKDKLSRLADIYEPYLLMKYPCVRRKTINPTEKKLTTSFANLMLCQGLAFSNRKAPGVECFPGALPKAAEQKSITIEFVADIRNEHHSTGLYLPPGGTLVITPADEISEKALSDWYLTVGSHTDRIFSRDEWYRFPIIHVRTSAKSRRIYSGFGGLVWVTNRREGTKIRLTFNGAVKAPYFNVRDPKNIAQWDTDKLKSPGPWAEIAGDMMVITVASKDVVDKTAAELKDLTSGLWDLAVKQDHHFRGTNWKTSRRERFAVDVQISIGYGHSGYPMMGFLSWTSSLINKVQNDKDISWGVCHEIGHNMQRLEWTYSVSSILYFYDIDFL